MLWQPDAPWPTCPLDHGPFDQIEFSTPADIRARRRLIETAAAGGRRLTTQEHIELQAHRPRTANPPTGLDFPLLPILQIHAPDVPWFEMPFQAELLQILWCPLLHHRPSSPPNGDGAPWVSVQFHLDIDPLTLLTPPRPQLIEYDWFVPEPCVLHPEPVTEYPQPPALNDSLAQRVEQWARDEYGNAEGDMGNYGQLFATAPGWKLGGHPDWSFGFPATAILCPCGAPMLFLCTIPSCEWDAGTASWAPLQDIELTTTNFGGRRNNGPTCVQVGNYQRMRIFVCSADPDHPVRSDIVL